MNLPPQLMDLILEKAMKHRLDPGIVAALCVAESSLDTWAVRFEPGWKWLLRPKKWAKLVRTTTRTEEMLQSSSWGLCQVMGAVSRELGHRGPIPELCVPAVGLEYGCKKLAELLARYGTYRDALAAYNAGSPRSKTGKAYAEKVIRLANG